MSASKLPTLPPLQALSAALEDIQRATERLSRLKDSKAKEGQKEESK